MIFATLPFISIAELIESTANVLEKFGHEPTAIMTTTNPTIDPRIVNKGP